MTITTGVLLVNLGTPSAPTVAAVKTFLRQFLQDPRVVDLPRHIWRPLLNVIILPRRAPKVAKLYKHIWRDEGSPLMVYSVRQRSLLEEALRNKGIDMPVALAMTYGAATIEAGWHALKAQGVNRVIVLPLYPQYSVTTTAPVFDSWARAMLKERNLPQLRFIYNYHDYPEYIQALATSVRQFWADNGQGEYLLISFHGIPERYEQEGDPYGKQCHQSARLLAQALGLEATQWGVSFQSRFGREKWLSPYSDEVIVAFAQRGIKRVDVISPAFSVDCLETLEEIQVQFRELFIAAGGEQFAYIPALNCDPLHIEMMASLICRELAAVN